MRCLGCHSQNGVEEHRLHLAFRIYRRQFTLAAGAQPHSTPGLSGQKQKSETIKIYRCDNIDVERAIGVQMCFGTGYVHDR